MVAYSRELQKLQDTRCMRGGGALKLTDIKMQDIKSQDRKVHDMKLTQKRQTLTLNRLRRFSTTASL